MAQASVISNNVLNALKFLTLQLVLLATITSWAAEPRDEHRYNEVFDESGQVREHYRVVSAHWARDVHHMGEYADETYEIFKRGKQDSNSVNDLPRIIPKDEYDIMVLGASQRERAMQAFLYDHYCGDKLYAKSGVISEELVNEIIARTGETGYQTLVDCSSDLNFLIGTDMIRGPDGVMYALEDNLGFVGGFGDIVLAQEISEQRYPELAKEYKYEKAIKFYKDLLKKYTEQAKVYGGKLVFFTDPNATDDSEEVRTIEIFESLGVEVIVPKADRELVYKKDGVYVQDKKGGKHREKVGFIILNLEHDDADISMEATLQLAILRAATNFLADKTEGPKALKQKVRERLAQFDPTSKDKDKQLRKIRKLLADTGWRVTKSHWMRNNEGLVKAIIEGRVGSSYSLGIEFMGDKEMYTYIPKFIQFYLQQKPIIQNIETYMLNIPGTQEVNEKVLDRILGKDRKGKNFKNWVIKPVDGLAGYGIIFGDEQTPEDIPDVIDRIKKSPHKLQAQRYTPPSEMPGNRIVDNRIHIYSTRDGSVVSPVPWTRAATADVSKLINVSQGGAVNAAFVVEKRAKRGKSCRQILAE